MCFSAEASFIVSGTLLIAGTAAMRKAIYPKDIPIALIPLLFAIQQLIEGLLWISLTHDDTSHLQFWLSNWYGVFIGIIWPLFAPFAVYCTEIDKTRKKIIASIGTTGFALAIYTIIGLLDQPIVAEIIDHSINYNHKVGGYQLVIVLYLLATCAPFLFSSYRHLYIAGITITAGFFVAFFAYQQTFASVWCFFAAIASTLIYFYFVQPVKKPLIPVP